jgi:hypothetical protein
MIAQLRQVLKSQSRALPQGCSTCERELMLQLQIALQSGGRAEEPAPVMALQVQRHIEAGF